MKTITTVVALLVLAAAGVSAQTKTVETRTTVDSTSGRTTVTNSTVIATDEDITPRNNMITINPLKFFLFYNLSYYRAVSDVVVVGVGVQMPTLADLSGFGVNAEVRFHPSAKRMRGFYVAPNISYNSLSASSGSFSGEVNESASIFSIGALLGWQWFPGDDFSMGLGIGVDKYFVSGSGSTTSSVDPFESYSGVAPALRFDIGYAW